jgi:hypothetical protein
LVDIPPGQTIRSQNGNDLHLAVANRVAQSIQPRPVEASAAVAFVVKDVAVVQVMIVGAGPGAQGGELAVDGLLAFLALGGDMG